MHIVTNLTLEGGIYQWKSALMIIYLTHSPELQENISLPELKSALEHLYHVHK